MEKMDAEELQEDVEDNGDAQLTESAEGDALEYDESAYVMYHRAQTGLYCVRTCIVNRIERWYPLIFKQ